MHEYSTNRIYLQEIEVDHLDERVMLWFQDEELMKFYSSSKNKITKDILVNAIAEGKKNNNVFTFGIYERAENKLIGMVKLGPINHAHKISDLATLIGDRDYLGKGLAVEAIRLGNKIAFERFDLRKLVSGMYESNTASIKAYTKADWIIEGRLQGHYLVDGCNEDRILVGCFNPKYFTDNDIEKAKAKECECRYL